MEKQTMTANPGTLLTEPRCRSCGCTDPDACWDPKLDQPCHWVEEDLCSACEEE